MDPTIFTANKFYQLHLLPMIISLSNGILSVWGINHGLEQYFWGVSILVSGLLLSFRKLDRLWVHTLFAGLLIASATGIPQVLLMGEYFANNPDYLALSQTLPVSARLYTLIMIPVVGIGIGLLLIPLSWVFYKILIIKKARR